MNSRFLRTVRKKLNFTDVNFGVVDIYPGMQIYTVTHV